MAKVMASRRDPDPEFAVVVTKKFEEKTGVMLWVALVNPDEAKVSVLEVPEVPLMPTSVKVAMPLTALTVAVPTVVAPVLTVMVTEAVLVVTVLPEASLIVMTGWVVNANPLGAPAAEVVMDV